MQITVVMGPNAPWLAQVQAQAPALPLPTAVLVVVSNMAQIMADSALCIGAADGTSWEGWTLNLPTLMLMLAENQKSIALALQTKGAAVVLNSASCKESAK